MIALEADALLPLRAVDQEVDDLARGRPAIDIVAEIDFNRTGNGTGGAVGIGPAERLRQEIGPAVDVANGIDA